MNKSSCLLRAIPDSMAFKRDGSEFHKQIALLVNELGGKGQPEKENCCLLVLIRESGCQIKV